MLLLYRVEGQTDAGWETIRVVRPNYQDTREVTKRVRRLIFFSKEIKAIEPIKADDAIAVAYAKALTIAARRGPEFKKVRINSTHRIDGKIVHKLVR